MPYIKRTVVAGDVVFIKKYYSARYGRKNLSVRAAKNAESSKQMQSINERNAIEKLTWLINTNFERGDLHVTFTYAGKCPTVEEAEENLRKLNRKLRKAYKEAGKEHKYVEVTEYENTRIHHHVVLKNIDIDILQDAWEHGSLHVRPLYSWGDFTSLAEYLVKETKKTFRNREIKRKRWNASKNLKKPEIKREIVDADSWTKTPKALAGYYIETDSIYTDLTDEGYPYQSYKMIKIPETKGKKKNGKLRSNTRAACS